MDKVVIRERVGFRVWIRTIQLVVVVVGLIGKGVAEVIQKSAGFLPAPLIFNSIIIMHCTCTPPTCAVLVVVPCDLVSESEAWML